jgi:hypothetical protein
MLQHEILGQSQDVSSLCNHGFRECGIHEISKLCCSAAICSWNLEERNSSVKEPDVIFCQDQYRRCNFKPAVNRLEFVYRYSAGRGCSPKYWNRSSRGSEETRRRRTHHFQGCHKNWRRLLKIWRRRTPFFDVAPDCNFDCFGLFHRIYPAARPQVLCVLLFDLFGIRALHPSGSSQLMYEEKCAKHCLTSSCYNATRRLWRPSVIAKSSPSRRRKPPKKHEVAKEKA